MPVRAVKKLTLTSGLSFEIVSGPPAMGLQTEDINVTSLSDNSVRKVPRHQIEEAEMTFMCAYSGTLAQVGASATIQVTAILDDGSQLQKSATGYIKSAIPQEVAVDGERRLLQQIVFVPDGSGSAGTTQG